LSIYIVIEVGARPISVRVASVYRVQSSGASVGDEAAVISLVGMSLLDQGGPWTRRAVAVQCGELTNCGRIASASTRHGSIAFLPITITGTLHFTKYNYNYNYKQLLSGQLQSQLLFLMTFSHVFANGNSPVNTPLLALLPVGTDTFIR